MRGSKPATEKQLLITLQQASDEYGPSYHSLYDQVKRGNLPAIRLGDSNRIWVRRSDINKLIDSSQSLGLSSGAKLITAERDRQRSTEGYSYTHDDSHVNFEMTRSAVAYALHATGSRDAAADYWPFGSCEWKPNADNPVRDLVKAGALIAAEIDRLQRLAS